MSKRPKIDQFMQIEGNSLYDYRKSLEKYCDYLESQLEREREGRLGILKNFADWITYDIFGEFSNEDLVKMFSEKYLTSKTNNNET